MRNSNYIKKIFRKSIDDITIKTIEDFFLSPQEETSVLEFKSGGVEIIDLYKEISAFLNTEGGLIIVGTPRERKESKGKNEIVFCQGDLTYSKFKNKDWLYQKIASNITPIPTDLKIVEFISNNGAIFLIDVPQSMNPPHQSSADGRYYIRLEREAKPAPHGLVQALFEKRRVPKLRASFKFEKVDECSDNVSVLIKNESSIPADKVSFIIDVYNISGVESDIKFILQHDSLGDKFTMSNKSNQILASVISIPLDFKVIHKSKEYIVFVGYWCKDTDFSFQFMTYNPINVEVVNSGSLKEGGASLLDELKRIEEKNSQAPQT